jgi:uncharacterized protein
MSYALVTGAAKGIGKAIAESLAKRKYNLILVDIDSKQLISTSTEIISRFGVQVEYLHIDVSAPRAAEIIFLTTRPLHDDITVLVNNAGFGVNTAFEDGQIEEQLNIVDVNAKAVVKLSYIFLPVLKKNVQTYLLNTSSTTAYQSVPYMNVYAATKSFVLSFTRGLSHELRNSNVSVSCLCPGSTDTDFVVRARMSAETLKLASRFNMDPAVVGEIAVSQLFKGRAEIIPGFTNKLHAWLPKFFPKRLTEKIAGNIYEKKETATTHFKPLSVNANALPV